MTIKKNIFLDKSQPEDFCPHLVGKPDKNKSKYHLLKQAFKQLLFGIISARPKRIKPSIPVYPNCIAVATGGNLGGAIISIPLIQSIRNKWPDAHLVILSNRQHGLDIIKRAGYGDTYYVIPEVTVFKMLLGDSSIQNLRNQLISHKIDLFVGNFDFRLDYLLPIKSIFCTVGQFRLDCADPNKVFYDYSVGFDFSNTNWLEGYWQILNVLGINEKKVPNITANKVIGLELLETISNNHGLSKRLLIGIASEVWSGATFKAFPKEKLLSLCLRLISEKNAQILIFGASGQDEFIKFLKTKNLDNHNSFLNLIGRFSIDQLPDIISACNVVIANDSGLMHLAAAVRTPVVPLYGMTDPNITWVYDESTNHCIIQRAKISPCYHKVNNVNSYCSNRDCIRNISTDFIYDNLTQLLK